MNGGFKYSLRMASKSYLGGVLLHFHFRLHREHWDMNMYCEFVLFAQRNYLNLLEFYKTLILDIDYWYKMSICNNIVTSENDTK